MTRRAVGLAIHSTPARCESPMNITRAITASRAAAASGAAALGGKPSAASPAPIDLRQYVSQRHRRMAQVQMTGFLLAAGDQFVEVLEGARANVSTILCEHVRDERFNDVVMITCGDVRERIFDGWRASVHTAVPKASIPVVLRYLATPDWDPASVCADRLLDVLQDLSAEL